MNVPRCGALLSFQKLTKFFGGFAACNEIDLDIAPGEIHALLGENGAGKSTLVKMLFGVLEPTGGQILWQGQPVAIAAPGEARKLGIGMVFQHFSLFEALTVAENIALSLDHAIPIDNIAEEARALSIAYGLPLDPHAHVADLSVGERQRIEIVRALLQNPKLIILDEPTSVLTPQEADKLFETLLNCAPRGVRFSISATAWRRCSASAIAPLCCAMAMSPEPAIRAGNAASLARMMVGSDVATMSRMRERATRARSSLRRQSFRHRAHPLRHAAAHLSGGALRRDPRHRRGRGQRAERTLRRTVGRISGLAEAIRHPQEARRQSGHYRPPAPRRRLRAGGAPWPCRRLRHETVRQSRPCPQPVGPQGVSGALLGIIRHMRSSATRRISKAMDVRKSGDDPAAGSLSGGNLQKFIVGRELDRQPACSSSTSRPGASMPGLQAAFARRSSISQELVPPSLSSARISTRSSKWRPILPSSAKAVSPAVPGRPNSTREKIGLLMGGLYETALLGGAPCALNSKNAPTSRSSFAFVSPLLALFLTLVFGAIMFALLGKDPIAALEAFFIEPLLEVWSLHELAIKAAPLILIAVGLAVCYRSNNWNIGAEGQFIFGAITGSYLPIVFYDWHSPLVLPLMLLLGMLGGALFAAIPALLKAHFNTNEILTS